jgi:hypothetical protein
MKKEQTIEIKENILYGHTDFKVIKAGKKIGVEFTMWQTKNPKFKMDSTIWANSIKELESKVQAFFLR